MYLLAGGHLANARAAWWIALLATGMTAHGVRAQDSLAVVRGTVLSLDEHEPVPFPTLTLDSAKRGVFGDSGGRFRINSVAPGRHRLRVRELGYSPVDTTFDVATPSGIELTVQLARVPHVLPPVVAGKAPACRTPGVSDTTLGPELARLTTELVTNADRVRLLTDRAPYDYLVEATISSHVDYRPELTRETVDTLEFSSSERHDYKPGDLIDPRLIGRSLTNHGYGSGPYIYLPELEDLAEPTFLSHHCFDFGGVDTAAGQPELRIDIRPLNRMRSADAMGSFYLDPQRFVAKRAVFRLTNGEDQVPPIRRLEAKIWYREIAPLIVVEDSARFDMVAGSPLTGGEITSVEQQHLIKIKCKKPRRGATPSSRAKRRPGTAEGVAPAYLPPNAIGDPDNLDDTPRLPCDRPDPSTNGG
jgi:hypothetical protein